jgi:hypothetical protein
MCTYTRAQSKKTRYLTGPASRQRSLTHGPTQLERHRRTHGPQGAPFLTSPQVGEQVNALHRVAHVDEGVKATRREQHVDHAGHGTNVRHSSNNTNCFASTRGRIDTCGDDHIVGMGPGDGRDGRIEPRAEGDRALFGGVGGAIVMGEKAHQQVVTAVVRHDGSGGVIGCAWRRQGLGWGARLSSTRGHRVWRQAPK